MARPLKKQKEAYIINVPNRRKTVPVRPAKFIKKRKKVNPFAKSISLIFAVLLVSYIFPFSYKNFIAPILNSKAMESISVDYNKLYKPTSLYLYNETFLNKNFLVKHQTKKPQMQTFYEAEPMYLLVGKLNALMKTYPMLQSAVYVWDFDSGKYVDIKAHELYPAASIIKIPILLELFRSVEIKQLKLSDKMTLKEYYRAEGSGDLQFSRSGNKYTLDQLARTMIQDSDNSATNMLMSAYGGKPAVNRAIRKWGLQNTYIETWLPDLQGTNKTTAKDIAVMLYNVDNSSFLSLRSRESIIDYMSNVKNNRLLQAGLPNNALLVHKTGDIGTMLGDAGIVWAPNGKKYIVVIMSKRPHNHPAGKEFIVKASSIIYDYVANN